MLRPITTAVMALKSVQGHRREIRVIEELNSSVERAETLSKTDAKVLLQYIFLRDRLGCSLYENRMATGCLIVVYRNETLSRIVACRWI